MKKLAQIFNLQEIKNVLFRFPIVVFLGFVFVILGIVSLYKTSWFYLYSQYSLGYLMFALALAVVSFLALALFLENVKFEKWKKVLCHVGLGLIVIGYNLYFVFVQRFTFKLEHVRYWIFFAGVILLLSIVWSLFKSDSSVFWKFNYHFITRAIFVGILMGVIYLGLLAAFLSVVFLFNLKKIDDNIFKILFSLYYLVGFVLGYLYLMLIPRDVNALQKMDYPKWLKSVAQFIFIPFSMLYVLIIYAYSFYALALGGKVETSVSWIVIGFSAFTILTAILLWPYKKESKYLNFIYKSIFWVNIPLSAVLFWAIILRVSDYGITEPRYAVFAYGVWLAFVSIYFSIKNSANLYRLIIPLIILIFISQIGPWNMYNVSMKDRVKNLDRQLHEMGAFETGSFQKLEKYSFVLEYPQKNNYYKLEREIRNMESMYGAEPFVLLFGRNEVEKIENCKAEYKKAIDEFNQKKKLNKNMKLDYPTNDCSSGFLELIFDYSVKK